MLNWEKKYQDYIEKVAKSKGTTPDKVEQYATVKTVKKYYMEEEHSNEEYKEDKADTNDEVEME